MTDQSLRHRATELLKFGVVGLSGTCVNLGLYALLSRPLSMSIYLASPLAIEASILWNFGLNDAWTFAGRSVLATSTFVRLGRFHAVCAVAGVVNYTLLVLLVESGGWWDIYANLFGIIAGAVLKFAVNSAWTWRTGTTISS